MSAAPPAVHVSALEVRFSGFRLGPLDLMVAPGERVALVGPNGAGKSTTMRVLGGRFPGYRGTVRVLGADIAVDRPGHRGRIGYLPERVPAFDWMTAAEHIDFVGAFHERWDAGRARELAEELEIPLETRTSQLSKGNRVKLALVCAEAHRPDLLLLDEPTSGIDPVMRGRLLDRLEHACPCGGDRTLVFSTHILEDVGRIADRVILLRDGRVLADDLVAGFRAEDPDAPLARILEHRLRHDD